MGSIIIFNYLKSKRPYDIYRQVRYFMHLICYMFVFCNVTIASPADTTIKNVRIVFTYSKNIFPAEWQTGSIKAEGQQIAEGEIERTKKVLVKALNKYPKVLFSQSLKAVYCMKYVSFYGVNYGGTNSTAELYLTNNGIVNGYTDKYLEQTFHHEFSSILFRNKIQLLDTAAWNAASSPSFANKDSLNGVGAIIKKEASQTIDTILCKKGVLTQYALSGLENDVNTFAQNLFKPEEQFWYAVETFPLIQKKAMLLINFYNRLNPVFTLTYFKKMATQ